MENNRDELGEVGIVGVAMRFNFLDSPKHRKMGVAHQPSRWYIMGLKGSRVFSFD